jgi:hypothetical protein
MVPIAYPIEYPQTNKQIDEKDKNVRGELN